MSGYELTYRSIMCYPTANAFKFVALNMESFEIQTLQETIPHY